MVKVEFLGPINKESLELEVKSLKELKVILGQDESLKEWLELCAVALNDEMVFDDETTLKDGDKICLLPPVCGG
ncbi:molybdopterin synthase, small subunit [Campylobacter subantarcticus LMG 24377]|uniref:Molybdopterin synthase, small subunit n=2 Tax=Campylobacter subantarcticus TaxID=497724 RepID=A0A0A8H854_9BACT|nr:MULTISPECIES: molybdopterin synthase, small subunit [Campylobacter]EAJ1261255.1 molybdopterin synthase, small subunit [Campylobacter lari]MCR8682634.1 molybdopterin synthase, small subunit [Campylobacter sp. LMG 17559]AJC90266.1 molybdopterin synthase, small subunit [Campylobacter subantarcticus LMG 24374]AJC91926.1 molybdopterin synthase, small subunit [Campylobacter subantarcticus LMG 24377]EAL3939413.1 molybdopterin synthase, small subunit [Campylobacter lari]